MAKFRFKYDYESFKEGQIVEGELVDNKNGSEPPKFVVVGKDSIPYGGKGGSIVDLISESGKAVAPKNIIGSTVLGFPLKPKHIIVGAAVLAVVFYLYKQNTK